MKKSTHRDSKPMTLFCAQIKCSKPLGHQASPIRSLNWID
jgi:hypothetical protein